MKLFQQIVQRRHLLAWLGTWVVMMVMTWGAIAILLNPNLGVRPSPSQLAQQSSAGDTRTKPAPTRIRQSSREDMALWALGIITLACIYGSVILSQHIKGMNRRR